MQHHLISHYHHTRVKSSKSCKSPGWWVGGTNGHGQVQIRPGSDKNKPNFEACDFVCSSDHFCAGLLPPCSLELYQHCKFSAVLSPNVSPILSLASTILINSLKDPREARWPLSQVSHHHFPFAFKLKWLFAWATNFVCFQAKISWLLNPAMS